MGLQVDADEPFRETQFSFLADMKDKLHKINRILCRWSELPDLFKVPPLYAGCSETASH
jgi:hypothetical protein